MEVFKDCNARESFNLPPWKVNENCVDLDLGELCTEDCSSETVECLSFCNSDDVFCQNKCIRHGFDCVDDCPCNINCPEGCKDCPAKICTSCTVPDQNPDYKRCVDKVESDLKKCIDNCHGDFACVNECTNRFLEDFENCPCEPGCPDGCPCLNYQCSGQSPPPPDGLSSVLILNRENWRQENPNHLPMLANFDRLITHEGLKISWYNNGPENLEFDFCGGLGGKHGPHILDGCEFVQAEGVSFDFNCSGALGYLATAEDPQAYIMVYDGKDHVQTYDGLDIWDNSLPGPKHQHTDTGATIPVYQGNPILISGDGVYWTNKVETYDINTGWTVRDDLEAPDNFARYVSVSGEFGVVIFPGWSSDRRTIWRLADDKWTNMGIAPWNVLRHYARAVLFSNNEIMVVGGELEQPFTKFTFNEDFTSLEGENLNNLPILSYVTEPYAILVPDGYCTI